MPCGWYGADPDHHETFMIHLHFCLQLDYQIAGPGCDLIFNIHAAKTARQSVLQESLLLNQNVAHTIDTDPPTHNRYLRLSAPPGALTVKYEAVVEINHYFGQPGQTREVPIPFIPAHVLQYIYPSRYCESDRLLQFAARAFGRQWQGYSRIQAIRDWVLDHTTFTANSSNSNTSAIDTLLNCTGVCRDFAHLMIALCRALNIPARFVTGIDYGADPILGPTDFHAYVEVYLADATGARWYVFDPSGTAIPMGFVRFATGRDAADVAFATIFGPVVSSSPSIQINAVAGPDGKLVIPWRCSEALSSSD